MSGRILVLAEETVLRYGAGERFERPSVPHLLVVSRYDEDADSWLEVTRKVAPQGFDVEREESVGEVLAEWGLSGSLRVEVLDHEGRTLAVKTVEA